MKDRTRCAIVRPIRVPGVPAICLSYTVRNLDSKKIIQLEVYLAELKNRY